MSRTVREFSLIGMAVGFLLVAVGCGGGSTANGGTALSLTTGGYPDVSGTYQVTDSSCSFATVDDEYDVDQDDAVIDIDRVLQPMGETGSSQPEAATPANATGDLATAPAGGSVAVLVSGKAPTNDPDVIAAPTRASPASSSVTTITRSGAITLIVDQGAEQFTCTANVALPFIPFSCTSANAICAFTIEQVEAGSSDTDTDAPVTGSTSHTIPILEE